MAVKITDSPDAREPEPVFYYSSTMHGDETSGYLLMLRLTEHICRNYGEDSLCTRLVDNVEIWINPLANPDGTYRSNDSIISNPVRENLDEFYQPWKDLNRNFPSPISGIVDHEPETIAQMRLMDSLYLVLAANIHDGAEVFNYPWDTWKSGVKLHPDNEWYIWAGRRYVDTVYDRRGIVTGYMSGFDDGITHGGDWYVIWGGRQDYVNYFLHAREVTLEINNRKFPNIDDHEFLWDANYPSMLQYIENCLFGIQGIVRNSRTGEPLRARISIPGHDGDESHVFSDSLTGYFARLIEAGTWDLEVEATGYIPGTLTGIEVEWDRYTEVLVELDPVAEGVYEYQELEAWPNPWTREANLRFRAVIPGMRYLDLYSLDGRLVLSERLPCPVPGTFEHTIGDESIQPGWYILRMVSPDGIQSIKLLKLQ